MFNLGFRLCVTFGLRGVTLDFVFVLNSGLGV